MLLSKNQDQVRPENHEHLNAIWLDLLDFYYRSTNRQSWENFLSNLKATVKIKNEIISCTAAFELYRLNDDRGIEYLKKFGVKSTNDDGIKAAILAKETKLELAENKLTNQGSKESFKFYRMLASVQFQLKRNIDTEISLAEWVEILADLSARNKAEQEMNNKNKSKRNGRNIISR